MNWVDWIIVVLLGVAVVQGAMAGALAQVLSLGGLVLGLVVGAYFAPRVTQWVTSPTAKAMTALLCVFGVATVLATVGRVIGTRVGNGLRATPLRSLDAALGIGVAVVVTLVSAWLVSSMIANAPINPIAVQVQRSAILRFVDRYLPPAPPVIARIQQLIDTSGLPLVFAQLEPQAAPRLPLPASPLVRAAFVHAAASTVKLESPACGGTEEGSGFVVAPGVVVTNAHVIAGARRSFIVANGATTAATPILFDPNLDIAVLRDNSVHAPLLQLADTTEGRGTAGATIGYPGGGPLTASAAVVLADLNATGRNIYGTSTTRRSIYEIESVVRPGNSGGPLVEPDGTVIGVVFARSTVNGDIGYALTSPAVRQQVFRAQSLDTPVGTGSCTSG